MAVYFEAKSDFRFINLRFKLYLGLLLCCKMLLQKIVNHDNIVAKNFTIMEKPYFEKLQLIN